MSLNTSRSNPTQLLAGPTTYSISPKLIGSWNKVSIGQYSTIATKTNGTLWMWGFNGTGSLGINDQVNRSSPVQVGSGTTWNQISTGVYNTLAIKS
jgi:alpha-tubulin suppressor-like RCC1 family protein